MSNVYASNHPLVAHKLSRLRDKQTEPKKFRELVREIAALLAYEATADLAVTPPELDTPLAKMTGAELQEKSGLVPSLRAGLGMVEGVWGLMPSAEVWHIGLYRDEHTLKPVEYYNKLPDSATVDMCLILDPMLATGGSATAAIEVLKEWGATRIKLLNLIAADVDADLVIANDPDGDRHGTVTGKAGLLNPNHYLAVAAHYLFGEGRDWPAGVGIGKTLVSSAMLDRVAAALGRPLVEVPVGFKWFVDGLLDGSLGFGGEESAGGSFLRRDGSVWTTDKDGIICCLLAAELTARSGRDPGEHYGELTERFGAPAYVRLDVAATREQKDVLKRLSPDQVDADELAGEPVTAVLTTAPGNDAPIGGLKVVAESGWFAARPSGTEDVYKVYAESFRGEAHLEQVVDAAQALVQRALAAAGVA